MFKVNSTRRKRSTSSSTMVGSSTPDTLGAPLTSFFEAETANALLTKPWLRLERGLRIQKLRAFADSFPGLTTDDEREALFAFLIKANDSKQLNTKSQIQYEMGVIQNIKGLKMFKSSEDAPILFKIEMGRHTKRCV